MRRYLALVLASVLAAISASALALGLGDIRLNSWLNQRLDAEIELVSAAADELESLEVRLADRAAFDRYGLDRDPFLNNLQFRVIRRSNGTAYVQITSTEPVREPFLTFLIEADWSSGRLLREYTLLIDPPTFADREQVAPQSQAPVATPAPQPVEREAPITESTQQSFAEQPRVAESEVGDIVSIPSLDTEADQAPARAESTYPQQTSDTYGPIQRNENLWSIANRLRPDESISINQMMIALYRANPEAFQGNINRLKAGYVLRIPRFDQVSSLSRREAFNEAKRHNEEWRAGSRPSAPQPEVDFQEPETTLETEPELSLVAPEEDVLADTGTGVGAGDESTDIGMSAEMPVDTGEEIDEGAYDLGVEAETEERLLDIEDESLQALQEQEDLIGEETEAPVLPDDLSAPEVEVAPELPVETVDTESAEVDNEAVAEADSTPPAAVVQPVRQPEPTLVEKLTARATEPLGMGIGAAILVLLLAGFLVIRKRREAARATAAAAMADWDESDDASDVTILADRNGDDDESTSSVFAHGIEHENTGTTRIEDDAEATQMLADADKTQLIDADGGNDFTETVAGGRAVTLDDNDPLSEADFHMAYGLYDQAAEVVQKAVERDPSRKEFHAKLAEIHFAANNTAGFLEAAKQLKEIAGPGDSDWENIAIMGRQIAPESDLFGEGDAGTSSVDLDFGSAGDEFSGEETVVKPETATASADDDMLDFDITGASVGEAAPAAKPQAPVPADDSSDLDFDLDIGGLGEAESETDHAKQKSASTDSSENDFDFDLGDMGGLGEESTAGTTASADKTFAPASSDDDETQTEFDKALQELSAFVDTNLPEQDAGDAVDNGELNLDEYSFDDSETDDRGNESGTGDDEDDI
ncbi:MAG: hypothetical protein KY410_06710, partial [Proteobacteria bacterium]|nr:hypothetical protein [Pseudomonadota bacterium]